MSDNLITQLFLSFLNNMSAMDSVDWLDVEVYCTACVHGRDEIYNSGDYEALINKVHRLCRDIPSCLRSASNQSALLKLAELSGIVSAMPEITHYRSFVYKANFDNMLLDHYKNNTSVIIGDSHVNFFSGHEMLEYTPIVYDMHWCRTINELPITAIHVGPGLAYNTMKYETSSQFREKTEYLLRNHIRRNSHVLVTLGEVDLRAHVFKQSEIQNREWHEIVDDIAENYIEFLRLIRDKGFVAGCWGPIASQSDTVPINPEDNRYPRVGSETERNKATEYFNQRMSKLCEKEGVLFLTLFDKLIDEEYRTRTEYYSPDGVHLGQAALPLAIPLLEENGFINVRK